jgi:O-methyltransferase
MTGLTARVLARLRILKDAAQGTLPETVRRDDMNAAFWALYEKCAPYTMTSPERLFALRQAVHHVGKARVPGVVVECGVWRGGSSMMAALAMQERGDYRQLWLYDTFEGMTEPGKYDLDYAGVDARIEYQQRIREDGSWAKASVHEVQANLARTGYPAERTTYVHGRVEDTLPGSAPDAIALLRLDTDWYESTRHELEHLWPRLSRGGVLIIDDYGHYGGARKAVDEYFAGTPLLLSRIDYTGRMAVKS